MIEIKYPITIAHAKSGGLLKRQDHEMRASSCHSICPHCGAVLIRLGSCFSCPLCGYGSCD
ncbi:MAG: hypothetical protein JSV44_01860 [Candidatus Zixiibacteriota bacterium]|nr:MAG: hypothetical protein JSV44_01860 [candidate division Zixibacteria bacterium]